MVVVETAATVANVATPALSFLPAAVGPLALPATKWGVGFASIQTINIYARAKGEEERPMKYSKGASLQEEKLENPIASKTGMFFFYFPALVVSAGFLFQNLQNLTAALLVVHFGKRVLETLFVHQYSGNMDKEAMYIVGTYYTTIAAIFSWTAQFTPVAEALVNPTVQALGLAAFAIGQSGNLYHHVLLANLRKQTGESATRYDAPKGGLFNQVACPHYFFELLSFLGIAMVSQQFICLLEVFGQASYFAVRSEQANDLYKMQFDEEEWPKSRKNFIPFIY